MQQLLIPELGTRMRLEAPWRFHLHREMRNGDMFDVVEDEYLSEIIRPEAAHLAELTDRIDTEMYRRDRKFKLIAITIPVGTILTLDRIYIRKGQDDFDSLTFTLVDSPDPILKPKKLGGKRTGRLRFWSKLQEANGLMFTNLGPAEKKPSKTRVSVYLTSRDFDTVFGGGELTFDPFRERRKLAKLSAGDEIVVTTGYGHSEKRLEAIILEIETGAFSIKIRRK